MLNNNNICIDLSAFKSFIDENSHNVINSFSDTTQECLTLNTTLIMDIIKIVKSNSTPLLTTEINNATDLLLYFTRYYNKQFRRYRSNESYILLILNIVGVSLSNFSKDSYKFLDYIYLNIKDFSTYSLEAKRYIETEDLRGLLFWLSHEINIDFDNIIENIYYEYVPPTITSEWSKNNRKEGEPIEFWFDKTQLGKSLFIVLYTKRCRYSYCAGCNLPKKSYTPSPNEEDTITTEQNSIYLQMDHIMFDSISRAEKNSIKEVTLSNNGNLFDADTMPYLSLLYAVDSCINNLPKLEKIVIESRIEVIDKEKLKTLKETIDRHNRNITLEIAIGLEIMNDELRNGYYRKGLSRDDITVFLNLLNEIYIETEEIKSKEETRRVEAKKSANEKKGANKAYLDGEERYSFPRDLVSCNGILSVKFYMMYMCIPNMFKIVDAKQNKQIKELSTYIPKKDSKDISLIPQNFAISDIQAASDFLSAYLKETKENNISIMIHINPTYMTEKLKKISVVKKELLNNCIIYGVTDEIQEDEKLNYATPTIDNISELLTQLKKSKKIGYFISSNDEGLSEEDTDNTYSKELELRKKIISFNIGNEI